MTKFDRQLTFNTKEYENFDELVEELFWNDLYLHEDNEIYIYDTNQNIWYSIEMRYSYSNILELFKDGKMIRFDEVKDDDFIDDLNEIFGY